VLEKNQPSRPNPVAPAIHVTLSTFQGRQNRID
jgi:hypothetical protein